MIIPSLLIFWVRNLLIYITVIESIRATDNFSLGGHRHSHVYCQTGWMTTMPLWPSISIMLTCDLLFLTLMFCTSLYMVSPLYRHHRRAKYEHRPSSQTPAEIKATQNIVLLVSCFAFFCCSNKLLFHLLFFVCMQENSCFRGNYCSIIVILSNHQSFLFDEKQ